MMDCRHEEEIAALRAKVTELSYEAFECAELLNAITKSLAGEDMESEVDRVAFLKKCSTIIEEIEIDMQAAKELTFE